MKKQKENSHEGITWSEMGKQNVQAEKVYSFASLSRETWERGLGSSIRDLTQADGTLKNDEKNVAYDWECTVSRHIFSSFCRAESSSRPVA